MKTKLYFVILLLLATMRVEASNTIVPKDSIIVTFGSKTRLIVYGENRQELDKIMKYDLNALLSDLHAKLDSAKTDTAYLAEEIDGRKYLKDKSDKDYVRIDLRGIHIKDGEVEVKIDSDGVSVRDEQTNEKEYRRTGKNFGKSGSGSSPRKGLTVALGLNTYGSNEPGSYQIEDYDLRPFGSRYISLGYIASARIVKGKKTGFYLDFGADFSWYNLMYDGNNTIVKTANGVVDFPNVQEGGSVVDMKKTKLVVPYVNLSIMPTVSFRNSFVSYVSAGVYGGYRLGSYTKLRREGSKDKDHVRQNYYLNDFRYGVAAELGLRNFVDLFVSYDLNTLHEDNRGPKINMLSFGIKL